MAASIVRENVWCAYSVWSILENLFQEGEHEDAQVVSKCTKLGLHQGFLKALEKHGVTQWEDCEKTVGSRESGEIFLAVSFLAEWINQRVPKQKNAKEYLTLALDNDENYKDEVLCEVAIRVENYFFTMSRYLFPCTCSRGSFRSNEKGGDLISKPYTSLDARGRIDTICAYAGISFS